MFGKLLRSALIAPVAVLMLMLAAPVVAQAANVDRDHTFGQSGWGANQQARGQDRRDAATAGQQVTRVGWRSDRRDDRRGHRSDRRDDRSDHWGDRRDDRHDRWSDRRYRRHQWHQDRWRRHWSRWDRRAGSRRHRHPHGHRWHPHRY